MTLRSMAEKLSRGKIFKRMFRVNSENHPIYITPDAQLKYLKVGPDKFDSDLIKIAEKFITADSVVWDIGANVGVFTFACASCLNSGTVISIEADPWLCSILKRTATLPFYKGKDIRIIPSAVSNNCGVSTFNIAARGRACNALDIVPGRSPMGGIREKIYVPTLTLDNLLENQPRPDFIKIDVEGAEAFVIEGAAKIISSARPIFYIEVDQNSYPLIHSSLGDSKYLFFNSDYTPIDHKHSDNVFCVPEEKLKLFRAS